MNRLALLRASLSLAQSMLEDANSYRWDRLEAKELEERRLLSSVDSASLKGIQATAEEISVAQQILIIHKEILAIAEPAREDLGVLLLAWQLVDAGET